MSLVEEMAELESAIAEAADSGSNDLLPELYKRRDALIARMMQEFAGNQEAVAGQISEHSAKAREELLQQRAQARADLMQRD